MKLNLIRNNFISRWWWTVDKTIISCTIIIMLISALMSATASPAVAERIGLSTFYFTQRQIIFLGASFFAIIILSLFSFKEIKKFAVLSFIVVMIGLISTILFGTEIKGAKRWINIAGISLQASELIKPFFAIVSAIVLSKKYEDKNFPSFFISSIIFIITAGLIIAQPDVGMTLTLAIIWGVQIFLAGLSWIWVSFIILGGMFTIVMSYIFLPHVTRRIDSFIYAESEANYQVNKSLDAFANGGLYGTGPGEGVVKLVLPDSHTDFIFSVIAEELGIISCIIIIIFYSTIILRGFYLIRQEANITIILALSGILIQIAFQAIVNIGVSINMLPTKGMTLPLISYGGSSMLGISIGIGFILALTRKKFYSHSYKNKINCYKFREMF